MKIEFIIPAYNAELHLKETLNSVFSQTTPENVEASITVVNDASNDNTEAIAHSHSVKLISNTENLGRGGAINKGAFSSDADFLIILDSDCQLENEHVLSHFFDYFSSQMKIVSGLTRTKGTGFWDEYQRKIYEKRLQSNDIAHQTSALLGIEKEVIIDSGGFDNNYKKYGFEDRDLLIKLKKSIPNEKIVTGDSRISAIHSDKITLKSTCEKLSLSAKNTAPIFKLKHPSEYNESNYGRLDNKTPKTLRKLLKRLSDRKIYLLCSFFDKKIENSKLPYSVKSLYVKVILAIAYTRNR